MYECPNCASNLRFDIASQMLYCEHCETRVDPYDFHKENDAEESVMSAAEAGMQDGTEKRYAVTVFTCPQCGGEILSEDTTAATFCSFCGSSTILDSRISKGRRPEYIIPFSQTKEDCEKAYKKMMRRAIFAPKELKEQAQIEKFRGIYMPYWVYSLKKKGPVTFLGRKSYRLGNYRYTRYYDIDCEIDEEYDGLAYDASATFSDNLSGAIAPFDLEKGKPFVPAFLSGFYADVSDVSRDVYEEDAEKVVVEDCCNRVSKMAVCRRYGVEKRDYSVKDALRPSKVTSELAMIPVWFLSYRNKDRVSYAVVNGQTGKVAADIPVDPKRYLVGSAMLAIPLFILLNLFLTITPTKILGIAMLLALLSILISNSQISAIRARELGEDDKGFMWYLRNKRLHERTKEEEQNIADSIAEGRRKNRAGNTLLGLLIRGFLKLLMVPVYMIFFMGCIVTMLRITDNMTSNAPHDDRVSLLVALIWVVVVSALSLFPVFLTTGGRYGRGRIFLMNLKKNLPTLGKPILGILVALLILFINPVRDEFYYLGAFLCMGTVLWSIMDIIRQHNKLTTRKLPQFNRRGGDENA